MSEAAARPTSNGISLVEMPPGDARLKEFVRFPFRLYRGDPRWCPQLEGDLLGNKLLGMTGLLTPQHPYHETATATHFMAYRDGEPVGRISAVVNRRVDDYMHTKLGFFGFFEVVEDYAVAETLLDAARDWCRAHGAEVLRGPGEYSNITHERQACLVEGFDQDVYIEHTYNPPYYAEFIERYGFAKAKDYVAYMLDVTQPRTERLTEVSSAVRKRGSFTTRALEVSKIESEIKIAIDIYNQAWADNWGFLPITDFEAEALAESLKMIIDPGLVRFAYHDGTPVAVLGVFPDPNLALTPRWKWYGDSDYVRAARLLKMRHHLKRMRLLLFGIVPGYRRLGVDALLFDEILDYAQAHGYTTCDISLLLEDNDLILSASRFMGAHEYKRWRIWDLPLTASTVPAE